jgi:hypothetical protein
MGLVSEKPIIAGPQPLPAEALLTEPYAIEGEVAFLYRGDVYVASNTEQDQFHLVESGNTCTCPGYAWRKTCRHLKVALQVRALAREQQRRVCPECGEARIPPPGSRVCAVCVLDGRL